MDSVNVTVTFEPTVMPVALAAGVLPVTVGGVVSAAAAVNDQVSGAAIVLPARSWAPLTVTLYALIYTTIALLFGLILFEDRDLA